jgi:2-desacetyl-2-hydroxyethyl bacteriochlorophyllide A dehydrogenase
MRAVFFPGDRTAEVRVIPDPVPGSRDVVVEIHASGMCGTDMKFYHGDSDLRAAGLLGSVVGGHEPCGVVVEIGSDVREEEARIGQRVMVHHYLGCGMCASCRSGWTQMCERRMPTAYGYTADGGHAELMVVGVSTLVPLPDELSFTAGAAISCGTGTAWGALRRLRVTGDQTVAIFGQGPVGLSATLLAISLGARVIALDVSPSRLARAREFGAAVTIDPTVMDAVAAVRDVTRGRGVDASIDASGAPLARRQAVQSARPWGRVAFVGEGGDVTFDVSPDLLRRQVQLHGVWTFSSVEQEACAAFVAERGVDLDALFTDRWELDQANEAYAAFERQSGGKGVFVR